MTPTTPTLALVPDQPAPRTTVNVTFGGRSAEISFPFDGTPTDDQVISFTEETLRSNPPETFRGMTLDQGILRGYVVDRKNGTDVVFVRPAAAFG